MQLARSAGRKPQDRFSRDETHTMVSALTILSF